MAYHLDSQTDNQVSLQNVARPFRYSVNLTLPDFAKNVAGNFVIDTQCKAASLPSFKLDTADFLFQGRKFLIPSKTSFDNTVKLTFYADETFYIHQEFVKWMQGLDSYFEVAEDGIIAQGLNGVTEFLTDVFEFEGDNKYLTQLTVTQQSYIGSGVVGYTFNNVYPIEVSEIELSDDAVGRVNEYTVTFAYSDYHVRQDAATLLDVGKTIL